MSLSVKSAKRYYDSLHESLKRELPQWENLSCGCTRNLKVFLMSLSILNRVDRNLLIECIRDCEKEIAARSKDGSIQEFQEHACHSVFLSRHLRQGKI